MHPHLGNRLVGSTIYGAFNTSDLGAAPITIAGTPLIRVYKNNSTTEDDSGITLTTDFDARTGLHHWAIDTSADGTFFSSGAEFFVVVTQGTVDGVSVVGKCVAQFSLQNWYAEAAAALTATVADSVPTDGTRPSVASGIYMIVQRLLESAVSGTTLTVKKVDGSTTLLTCTLDSATTPTSITRAS